MNIVRLGMIVALGIVAWYALTVYAAMPIERVSVEPTTVQQNVTFMCPAVDNRWSGSGAILVSCVAVGGALGVAAVDLRRRVY